jgi:hypothetical protein
MEALVDNAHRAAAELGLDREPAEMVDRRRTLLLHQPVTNPMRRCPREDVA